MSSCTNHDLHLLRDWVPANQLSVNASKTKYIACSNHVDGDVCDVLLYNDNFLLERVNNTKFLRSLYR